MAEMCHSGNALIVVLRNTCLLLDFPGVRGGRLGSVRSQEIGQGRNLSSESASSEVTDEMRRRDIR